MPEKLTSLARNQLTRIIAFAQLPLSPLTYSFFGYSRYNQKKKDCPHIRLLLDSVTLLYATAICSAHTMLSR